MQRRSLSELNDDFDFDWNNFTTIKRNEGKIEGLKHAVAAVTSDALSGKERLAWGRLCYKLGTYYLHVKRDPDAALVYLDKAKRVPLPAQELLWITNHFAFYHQQKIFLASIGEVEVEVKEVNAHYTQAIENCNQIMRRHDTLQKKDVESIKTVAFAYCVRASMHFENERKDLEQAESDYRTALDFYKTHDLLDDQYAMMKNRYAQILMGQKQFTQADQTYEELAGYWEAQRGRGLNPHQARFEISYAQYLEICFAQQGKAQQRELLVSALNHYKKALHILNELEEAGAPLTKRIKECHRALHEKLLNMPAYSESAAVCKFSPAQAPQVSQTAPENQPTQTEVVKFSVN